jgi:adenine-specific DNA-methyltransferase
MPRKPDEPQVERIAAQSPDIRAELREQLRALVPEAFAEGQLDAAKLKALLGENGDAGPERYSFSWAGKRDAIGMLQLPTRATLMPDRDNSVNFDEAQHVFIEGENLEVLKVLYRSYFGRVKMIYIDPPYNTGNDFIYPDDFADPLDHYLRITGQKNGDGDYTTSQVDRNGRIHSAWLSMMYPRLVYARQLLSNDGAIFISIDDVEAHNLRLLLNDIFGEENFVTQIEWQKRYTRSNNTAGFTSVIEHVVVYRKTDNFAPNLMERDEEANARYSNPDNDHRGPWKAIPFTNPASVKERPNLCYPITNPSTKEVIIPEKKAWRSEKAVFDAHTRENKVWWGKDGKSKAPSIKLFLSEAKQGMTPINFWDYEFAGHTDIANAEVKEIFGDKVFDTPKPTQLIKRMLELATASDQRHICLDFFAGSGTAAQAVIEKNREDGGNRQFILVQLPERIPQNLPAFTAGFKNISEIANRRVKWAIQKINDNKSMESLGVRKFSLVESNVRCWTGVDDKDADALATQIEAFADSLVPGWKPEDVIWEVALREGYSLTSRVEKVWDTGKQNFWRVTDPDREQSFVICLDGTLTLDAVRALKLKKDSLFVCRDAALDDTLSANLALQCRLKVL